MVHIPSLPSSPLDALLDSGGATWCGLQHIHGQETIHFALHASAPGWIYACIRPPLLYSRTTWGLVWLDALIVPGAPTRCTHPWEDNRSPSAAWLWATVHIPEALRQGVVHFYTDAPGGRVVTSVR